MIDFIQNVVHFIQSGFDDAFNFIFWGVFVGYIVRKKIGDMLIRLGNKLAAKNERNMAIWTHYQHKVDGEGHDHDNVLDCHEGRCKVFTQYAA